MKTFAAFAALAIAAVVAAPAGAKSANEIRVSITGKNSVQIENELKAAAATVCGAADAACVDTALMSAHRQLASIMRARDTGKPVAAETVSVVRISLKGKTQDQIHAEIRTAAQTVCKAELQNLSVSSYSACVADAVRAAKAQLQARIGAAA
jgi:UrcA family protein